MNLILLLFKILTAPLLFASDVYCIRNLFLPRTGDININSLIDENLSNVTNFASLLGAGRTLAYPFSAGMLLAISTIANENNWKVSDAGFTRVLNVPRDEIVESYGTLMEMLETDENVTLSNILFAFRPNYSPSEALADTLMTEVREASWTKETWKDTYNAMVDHLGNVTNEKIHTLLIPSVTKIGTPFRKTTEAVVLSTFHYINTWQYPWTEAEIGKFQANEGIPYLKVEAKFWVANEEDYVAVAVPLEGGTKNVVFVLPNMNITSKYFRNPDDDDEETTDIVPFPKKWELKTMRLKVPAFNTTDVDQYGQELEQAGMNETFCTILRDFFGKYPYYLRPMVQVNFLDFNEDFVELSSATGVAVEKFQSFFSVINQGSGTGNDEDVKKTGNPQTPAKPEGSSSSKTPNPPTTPNNKAEARDTISATSDAKPGYINLDAPADIPTLSFDRPFLWYLNDTEIGPLFFGTVENLVNLAFPPNNTEPGDEDGGNTTMPPPSENDMNKGNGTAADSDALIMSEIEKYYTWSCRSFALSIGQHFSPSIGFDGKILESDEEKTKPTS